MMFHNVPPAVLVRFLREHRSEWADFNVDAYSAASVKASPYGYQGTRPTRFAGSQIIMPLGLTIEHEEMLEVIRLEGHAVGQEDPFVSRDIHLLQLCSGIDENAVGRVLDKYFLSPNPKHRESYISLLLLFSVASAKVFFKA
ncbi:hypothetical protein HanRHA438_Chr10g0432041 [Helianthus annuus]|uniref:homeobox-leucine zipper protein REVOLUTA-like n=1 Tax=Helianthus annuus TaxID=4232 RepID=UPI000B8F1F15|nr:homeobox-leucine zipper protein REVOLUTA-like [Helianthus annuus]XP_021992831.1 homeobox-leucine zipper protein REVOLUTA-like [Helianthus annuus]XP_035834944.1 homeobox-leucine zipper protein REVOLUTA-like [Helianthus annuus]XP_035834945.1 homeobox-leucine zipper protein REVOLUTA-like [Helianthus annuus]KAJ0519803.1 hypothetical protein HanIR_Chr10g0452331 [Helianthus annuus]KAJ0528435.1 putative class III homeodomain-leucine zipper family [Helianthus annuus]KAJ0695379.1 putative class III